MSTSSGCTHRRGHAGEPAHRAQADVEVEDLAQRHVERADAATDRRGERALDPDQVRAERLDGLVGQPVAGLVERLLAGQDLLPGDLVAVLGRGRVEHELGRGPDVDAGAVAFDEGDDGLVGDRERAVVAHADEVCHRRDARGQPDFVPIGPGPRVGTAESVADSAAPDRITTVDPLEEDRLRVFSRDDLPSCGSGDRGLRRSRIGTPYFYVQVSQRSPRAGTAPHGMA